MSNEDYERDFHQEYKDDLAQGLIYEDGTQRDPEPPDPDDPEDTADGFSAAQDAPSGDEAPF
jgi:hypothetical protein